MSLKATYANGSAMIVRDAATAITISLIGGVMCVAIAVIFYWAFFTQADLDDVGKIFITGFCGVFGLAGIAILVQLPGWARTWIASGGVETLRTDLAGITITSAIGAKPKTVSWDVVEKIILAHTYKSIDRDETSFSWGKAVVFLKPGYADAYPDLKKLIGGAQQSAEGKAFLFCDIPRKDLYDVQATLRLGVPGSIPIDVAQTIEFDYKAHKDLFIAP